MDLASASEDEPIPANEPLKAALACPIALHESNLDECQFVAGGDQKREELTPEGNSRTSTTVACHAQSPSELVRENLSEIGQESSFAARGITKTSDLGFEPNEDQQTSQRCKDAALDVNTGRHGDQLTVCVADDDLDLEKGISGMRLDNQMNGIDSKQNKAIENKNLDRNGSSRERVCRVCYMGFAAQPDSGPAIELGCQCKHDLALAHRQCAEAWFKIKGNRICEICGSTVENVSGSNESTFMENWNEGDSRIAVTSDNERCWQNHRIFNILLSCMVFAFVLPWIFHAGSLFK